MIKAIIKDSLLYLSSKIIVALLNLYVIYAILDFYGDDVYAHYSIALLIALTVSSFTSTWLSQAFLRKFKDEDEIKEFISFAFIIINIFNFVIILLYFSIIGTEGGDKYLLFFLSVSQNIYSLGRALFQKKREIKRFFYYDVARMFLIFIIIKLSTMLKGDVNTIIFSFFVGNMIFIKPLYELFTKFSFRFEKYKPKLKEWFTFGFPVGLWLTIAAGQLLIDREMLNYFYGINSSGVYSYYYDLIIKTCSLIIIPISNALYPILVSEEDKITNYNRISFNLCFFSLAISISFTVIFYFSFPFINSIYEMKYSSLNLSALFYGALLWQLGLIYQKPLEMMNRTKLMVVNLFICLIVSSIINIVFGVYFSSEHYTYTVAISSTLYLLLTYISSTTIRRSNYGKR